MKQFVTQLALIALGAYAASADQPGAEPVRMELTNFVSETGRLTDTMHDQDFTLKDANPNYLNMDVMSLLFDQPKVEDQILSRKIKQFKLKEQRLRKQRDAEMYGGQKKRLGSDERSQLTNYRDSLYYGKLYMGEQYQEVQVIIDTSSDWLMVEGRECENCKENRYDPATSSYFKFNNNRTDNLQYGSMVHVRAREVDDQICLGFDRACMQPYKWYLITEQFGIPPQVDGILGLTQGREPRGDVTMPKDFEIGPLFMDYIVKTGWVTEKTFSTHFEGFSGTSYLDFGPVNYTGIASLDQYVELYSNDGFFYSVFPNAIRFGDENFGDRFSLLEKTAIFSSAMSVSMVPKSLSKEFFRHLLRDIDHVEQDGLFFVECGVRRPRDVFLMIQDRWLHIKGDDMVIDISQDQDMQVCIINWLPSVDDFWVLGNAVYKDYYVTHKPDEAIIAFTPTEKRNKEPLFKDFLPVKPMSLAYDWPAMLGKLFGSAIIGVLIWVLSQYGFVANSWVGITFLNAQGSLAAYTKKANMKNVVETQLKSMSADEVQSLINNLAQKSSGNLNQMH